MSKYEWACVVGSGVLGGLVTTALFRLGLTGDPPLLVGVSIGVLVLLLTLSRKPS